MHTLVEQNNAIRVLDSILVEKAKENLTNLSFPTTRTEAWKYTRLTKLSSKKFTVRKTTDVTLPKPLLPDSLHLIFINGFLVQKGHFEKQEVVLDALSEQNPIKDSVLPLDGELFNNLNTLHATDGAYVHISANHQLDKPIELTFILTGKQSAATIRNKIVVDKNSSCKLLMHFISNTCEESFTNCITEISLHENSQLYIDKVQEETGAFTICTEHVEQLANSTFTLNTATLDGNLVRNNVNIFVKGQNCETNLNGVYILRNQQHVDNHTCIDHITPNCNSNELYKGVIYDKATGVFNGKVFVRQDAQKTNAFQQNANVLMGKDASINSKPELEIYADDVKCSHGSTTGQLDEQAIFYLRARGISEQTARQLVVSAFASEAIDKFGFEEVKERISLRLN